MEEKRIYLNCPFEEKDQCKELGGKWDGDKKKWFITEDMDSEPFAEWLEPSDTNVETAESETATSPEKTYINCSFEDKDECKSLGGKWDSDARKWYIPAGMDKSAFAKWL